MSHRLRIALVSDESVGAYMAAGGLRVLNLALALTRTGHDVAIFAEHRDSGADIDSKRNRVGPIENVLFQNIPVFAPETFSSARDRYDLAIAGTLSRRALPGLMRFGKPIIHDLICPFMLENRHLHATLPRLKRAAWEKEMARDFTSLALRSSVWLVASERQRHFWTGVLTASNVWRTGYTDPPNVFEMPNGVDEPELIESSELSADVRSLIERLDAMSNENRIVVHGGVHAWLTFEPMVDALASLLRQGINVRLYLTGAKPPFGDSALTPGASRFLSLVAEKGLSAHVEPLTWLPYRERFEVLRRMQLGINLHAQGLETEISYRNRLLDFAAAEIPLLTSTGDIVSERMIDAGIALPIMGLSPDNIASLIARALDARWGGNYHLACAGFRSAWNWASALKPLEDAIACALSARSPIEILGGPPGGIDETAYCALRSLLKNRLRT